MYWKIGRELSRKKSTIVAQRKQIYQNKENTFNEAGNARENDRCRQSIQKKLNAEDAAQ